MVLHLPFADPPVVAEAVDCAATVDSQVLAPVEAEDWQQLVLIIAGLLRRGPLLMVDGGFKRTVDLENDVFEVVNILTYGSDYLAFRQDDRLVVVVRVGFLQTRLNGGSIVHRLVQGGILTGLVDGTAVRDQV